MVDDATLPFSLRDASPKLQARKMRFEVVQGADQGLVVELPGPEARIGSGANCELVLHDPASARISTTAWRSSPSACRRCASASATSPCSSATSRSSTSRARAAG